MELWIETPVRWHSAHYEAGCIESRQLLPKTLLLRRHEKTACTDVHCLHYQNHLPLQPRRFDQGSESHYRRLTDSLSQGIPLSSLSSFQPLAWLAMLIPSHSAPRFIRLSVFTKVPPRSNKGVVTRPSSTFATRDHRSGLIP